MQLSQILQSDAVKTIASCSSKKRLFHDIGDMAESCYGLKPSAVIDALIDRENLGPTGVGHGVALPHARMAGVDGVKGIFLRLDKPLNFDAVDRQPVDLVFALIAPESAGVEHLKALALVSRTFRNEQVCAKLRANSDPVTLFTILTSVESSQAA
jgi:PTS system nitrogen regulatory IIA component